MVLSSGLISLSSRLGYVIKSYIEEWVKNCCDCRLVIVQKKKSQKEFDWQSLNCVTRNKSLLKMRDTPILQNQRWQP